MNEILLVILVGMVSVGYLSLGLIFYGFCFSYWQDEYPASAGTENVVISIIFSLLFPMFLLPFILVGGWKHGWRLN